MALTICILCGHPAHEHIGTTGCFDLIWPDDDDPPSLCPCTRSEAEVYDQTVEED